ncbi:Kinesin- protein 12 [Terramyces sp. JEL0728]|nr:Kinesin- protein 12 [Terramyces sp. JEL0728]
MEKHHRINAKPAVRVNDDGKTVQLYSPDGKISVMSFNRVFDEDSDQKVMFSESGVTELIHQALKGYATTIFAFGQTGSGKTFTITGPDETTPETVGIVPRALSGMFEEIKKQKSSKAISDIRIQASYLEIYNENVLDLLNPQNFGLPVRWTAERGFFVERLFVVDCDNLDDCLAVLEEGIRNRTTGSHDMNEHSSRSHSLLTIYLEISGFDDTDGHVQQRYGKISFVDLAGSERVKESKPTLDTFNEALSINKSLLTLGKCISALADPKKTGGHVPFRDSKLTKLLSDSLGGKGSALMISCISPSLTNFNETLKTLRYAQQARKITNKPSIQLDPQEELLVNLKKEIKGLKQENQKLRQLLEGEPQFSTILHKIIKESEENSNLYKSRPPSPFYSRKSTHPEKINPEIRLKDVKKLQERNSRSAKTDNRVVHEQKFNQSSKVNSQNRTSSVRRNSLKLPNIGKRAPSRQDGAKTPSKQRVDEMRKSFAPAGYPVIKPSARHTRTKTDEPERPHRKESKPVVDKFLSEQGKSIEPLHKKKTVEIKTPGNEPATSTKAPKTPYPKENAGGNPKKQRGVNEEHIQPKSPEPATSKIQPILPSSKSKSREPSKSKALADATLPEHTKKKETEPSNAKNVSEKSKSTEPAKHRVTDNPKTSESANPKKLAEKSKSPVVAESNTNKTELARKPGAKSQTPGPKSPEPSKTNSVKRNAKSPEPSQKETKPAAQNTRQKTKEKDSKITLPTISKSPEPNKSKSPDPKE